jgi:predicted PolB exonuclease-like 3'-5' exonuclease
MKFSFEQLNKILFLDIETVPQYESWNKLSLRQQELWEQKAIHDVAYKNGKLSLEESYSRAGIYAEFGKIICVSFGIMVKEGKDYVFRIKSIAEENEYLLLNKVCKLFNNLSDDTLLCAHNGKEFDYPYLCRRMLINEIQIPELLEIRNKKPWEIKHLDTLELWKFGDYKNFTSLDLLAECFGLPTSKGEMDGSKVYETFYFEKNLEKITKYCEQDVLLLANVFMKMNYLPAINEESVVFAK